MPIFILTIFNNLIFNLNHKQSYKFTSKQTHFFPFTFLLIYNNTILNMNKNAGYHNLQTFTTSNYENLLFFYKFNFRYEIFNRKTPMIFQNLMKMDYQEFCIRGNKYLA